MLICFLKPVDVTGPCAEGPVHPAQAREGSRYSRVLNGYSLPSLQSVHPRSTDCAEDYIPLVTTELVRFLVFYQHSGHRDLSDADPESVTALVANAVTTAQAWRELNETAWESHLRSLDRGRTVQTNAHSEERAAVNRQPKEQVREEAIDAVGAAIATLLTT